MVVFVLAAGCLALAEQPEAWYPAQQAPDSQASQNQTGPVAPQAGDQQPGTPSVQPGVQTGQQPVAPTSDDPRLDQPMQPLAPADSSSLGTGGTQSAPATAPLVPDTTPLNTPQQLTLGSAAGGHNYFTPSFRFTQYGMLTNGVGGWDTMPVTNVSGTGEMLHNWSHANLLLDYTSGGSIYPSDSSLTSPFQTAGMQLGVDIHRWRISLTDQASYLPESAFGYFGVGTGLIGTGLGTQFTPNQSILTDTTRLSNTVATTVSYRLSGRSTLHFSGSYGILRFQGGTLTNSDSFNYSGGYDRTFGRNTLGLSYTGLMITYGGQDTSIRTDAFNVAFGRRLTGRLAWQVAGGPQVRTVSSAGLPADSGASWNLNSGLTYQIGRLLLSSSFARNTTAGAGVVDGVETYEWMVGAKRTLGRQWMGDANFGIARNTTLAQTSVSNYQFQTEFVGVQVSRVVSHEASVFVSYNFQHQTTDFAAFGETFDRHVFGAGFQWQRRPLAVNPF